MKTKKMRNGMMKLALTLAVAFVALAARAENRLYINPFIVADYEPVTVEIMLDNSDAVATLDFELSIPDALQMVSDPVKVESRFASNQVLRYNPANMKGLVISLNSLPFIGNKGAVATFQVKAKPGTLSTELKTYDIGLNNIIMGLATGAQVPCEKSTVSTVTFASAKLDLTMPEVYTIAPAETFEMSLGITNDIAVKGMQFRLLLPEGFTADPESFRVNTRCGGGTVAVAKQIGNIVNVEVMSMGGEAAIPEAGEGTFMTFNLTAPATFKSETETVTFSNVVLSIGNNNPWPAAAVSTTLRNTDPSYQTALALVQQLRDELATALNIIASDCPDVKEGFTGDAIVADIDALAAKVESANADKTLIDDYTQVSVPAEAIRGEISKLVEEAKAAQKAHEDAVAAEQKRKADNQAAYDADLALIADYQKQLDAAEATVEKDYPAYADAEAEAALQSRIDALKAAADAAFKAVETEGNYDANLNTEGLAEAIAALVENAKAAKEAADAAAEAARQAANQAAYDADLAIVAAFQKELDDAEGIIAADYAGYGDAEAAAAVQSRIDALKAAADAAFKAVETEGSYDAKLNIEGLSDSIEALVDAAKAAKEKADAEAAAAEAARQAANKEAYDADLAVVAAFQKELGDAQALIAADYAGYGDAAAAAAVQTRIDGLKASANAAYKAVETAGEYSNTLNTEGLSASILALVDTAKAAKEKADAEAAAAAAEAARQAANKAAYDADLATVTSLLAEYRAIVGQIQSEYAEYEDVSAELAVRNSLDAVKDDVDAAYKKVATEGEYSYSLPYETLKASIQKLLTDAQSRKAIAEANAAEAARLAANKAAYDADLAVVSAFQKELDDAQAIIAADFAGYGDAEAAAAVQTRINGLKASADNAYKAVETAGEYSNTLNTEGLSASIVALVDTAKAAKEKADADAAAAEAARQATNKAAYDADLAVVAAFQKELGDAQALIAADYAGYGDATAAAAVQTRIDALKASADNAYKAVETAGEYKNTLNTEGLSASIVALVDAAKAAKEKADAEAAAAAAEAARQAANKAAYDADLATVTSLLGEYRAVVGQIQSEYAEYEDVSAELAVRNSLDAVKEDVDAAYKKVATEGEYTFALPYETLKASIQKLLTDAQTRKLAADAAAAEAARQAANKAAYDADLAVVAAFQKELDDAQALIATDYAGYGDATAAAVVQARLDGLKASADAVYKAVETAGEYKNTLNTEGISASIIALVDAAKAAKEKADADAAAAEAARQEMNKAAYDADLAVAAAFQKELDDAQALIAAEYAGYGDAAAVAAVQTRIDGLKASADAAYKAVETEGEYKNTLNIEGLSASIEALVDAAKTAKEKADAEAAAAAAEAARQAANKAAYDADMELVSALYVDYRTIVGQIQSEYPDYEDVSSELAVRNNLDAVKDDVEAAYKKVAAEGEYSFELPYEALKASILKLLTDAEARKVAADAAAAEAARQEANKAAYDADMETVAALDNELAAAVASIKEEHPENFKQETVDEIKAMISDLSTKIADAYAAVAEAGEYSSPVNDTEIDTVKAAIVKMVEDSKISSVLGISADELENAEYYTVEGHRVAQPIRGAVNIVRVGGKTMKIYVR